MKNKKGFTLIELLAVIVILGLLMAIAIPSVTKYITESRKKTVVSTIGNYITAMVNEVNDLTYTFTKNNTIYAVPIECISLERGGTNPLGAWHQANSSYWAYVLVQYNDETSSYIYGYTFKDSAGYGLYPTSQVKLNEQGKQIKTGLELSRPTNGKITNITAIDNWHGFYVSESTDLVVLSAATEGNIGEDNKTCTLQQKGDNYAQVEDEKTKNLSNLVLKNNTIVTTNPTLTTTNEKSGDVDGLYKSVATNSGNATYYFRGLVNNYVEFAGLKWKIIRINEDGTVRLILDGMVGNGGQRFNTVINTYDKMYYSGSEAKKLVDNWYQENIVDKGYDSYVSTGTFCEEAKVNYSSEYSGVSAKMIAYSDYVPNFKCKYDGNNKGIINGKVGLITYDEVIFAGGYVHEFNSKYYLYNTNYHIWTMSPAGFYGSAWGWMLALGFDGNSGSPTQMIVAATCILQPVINLKTDVIATGTGTSSDPYVVQTK